MMGRRLRVLLVEDDEDDAELVMRALRKAGHVVTAHRVHDGAALTAALAQPWDVVLSDYAMHGFSGMQALGLCRTLAGDVPFILLSGTVGEETAVDMMKAGANDYVMKHNLARLAPAVLREMHDAAARADLRRIELALVESEKRFHAFMDASPFVASIKDEAGRYLYVNERWSAAFGAQSAAWRTADDGDAAMAVADDAGATDSTNAFHATGLPVSYWKNTRFPFLGASGQQLLGEFSTDVTALRASEATIRRLAFRDPLTGLPNRRLMHDRLAHALALAARSSEFGALLFLDLDNFKTLNDTYGHGAGDQILRQTGERISACVRAHDTVARAGGDEFVIILEKLNDVEAVAAAEVDAIGRKIVAAIHRPYALDGALHRISASVGMTLFCDLRHSADELMKRADIALYSAKGSGRNIQMLFDPAMQARVAQRGALEADLRLGLAQRHFVLHYQAQVDSTGTLRGVEALLRLHQPGKAVVMPAAFIALAEETGLIVEIGYWTLETACVQLRAWSIDSACAPLTIAVNVSARQFGDDGFVARVLDIIERIGANPHRLIVELTESLLLDDVERTIEKMTVLRQRGIRFSLDDFGIGFSSLSYLKRLPLYEIKIDRTFVQDVITDVNDAVIVRAIIGLASSFGLSIIAEGVENLAQRDFLSRNGCQRFQGYWFGRPVPVELLDTGDRQLAHRQLRIGADASPAGVDEHASLPA